MTDVATRPTIEEKLDLILGHLTEVMALLEKYRPVIEAYLDPAASGPVAWAVRRRTGKIK